MSKQRLLITGAAGRIGQHLSKHWQERFELVLADKLEPPPGPFPFSQTDFADLEAIKPLFTDIHTVIHLAADPRPKAPWDSLLVNNIIATYNVLEAAHQARCQRLIFTSSVNAVAGYPAEVQIKENLMAVAPPSLYGASKAWGEAVGRFYADHKDLSVFCLRIGALMQENDKRLVPGHPHLDIALTYADLARLFDACLSTDISVRFGIFHGISDNRYKRLDLSEARRVLGYEPKDDAFVLAGMVGPERPDHLFENR